MDIAAAVAVLVGCVVTSYCVWFFSGRYVGELSLVGGLPNLARMAYGFTSVACFRDKSVKASSVECHRVRNKVK